MVKLPKRILHSHTHNIGWLHVSSQYQLYSVFSAYIGRNPLTSTAVTCKSLMLEIQNDVTSKIPKASYAYPPDITIQRYKDLFSTWPLCLVFVMSNFSSISSFVSSFFLTSS